MTVRARRAPVDLGPVLDAVTDNWEPGKVIAERAGIDPRTAGPRLAALEREGKVQYSHSEELDVRVYRIVRDAPSENALTTHVAVELTETSWVPQGPMSYEQWEEAGRNLQRMARSTNWWLGDWVLWGEKHYGEMYDQAIDLTGLEYQTLANTVWVAKNVEVSLRRENLSWSHHKEIASLDPPAQSEWLDKAEEEGMTVARLRSRLQGTSKDAPDPDQQLAPTHIGRLTFKFVAESDEHAQQKIKELAAKLERLGVSVTHKKTDAL